MLWGAAVDVMVLVSLPNQAANLSLPPAVLAEEPAFVDVFAVSLSMSLPVVAAAVKVCAAVWVSSLSLFCVALAA